MEDADFSDEFCRFLQSTLPTVEAAELLLLLAGDATAAWRPKQAAERLPAMSEAGAAKILQSLHASGLALAGVDQSYQYRPSSEALRAHVDTLAKAYEERPVTLIRIIYALRDNKIRSFAEAFKIRKR